MPVHTVGLNRYPTPLSVSDLFNLTASEKNTPPNQFSPAERLGSTHGDTFSIRFQGLAAPSLRRYECMAGRTSYDKPVLELLNETVPARGNVLEVGFHRGNNLIPIAKHPKQFQVYGADISPSLVDQLQSQVSRAWGSWRQRVYLAPWSVSSPERFPWPEKTGQFNGVVAVHVLSHLPEASFIAAGQHLSKILAPGGVLAATVLRSGPLHIEPDDSDVTGGTVYHSDAQIQEAFQGLTPIKNRPTPYSPKLAKAWNLNARSLSWLYFQKPV